MANAREKQQKRNKASLWAHMFRECSLWLVGPMVTGAHGYWGPWLLGSMVTGAHGEAGYPVSSRAQPMLIRWWPRSRKSQESIRNKVLTSQVLSSVTHFLQLDTPAPIRHCQIMNSWMDESYVKIRNLMIQSPPNDMILQLGTCPSQGFYVCTPS